MSSWHDTLYCRICCSPIKACRSRRLIQLRWSLLQWRLDSLNGQLLTLLLLLRRGGGKGSHVSGSSSCPTARPPTLISVPTGLPIPHSIPRGSCSGVCFSSMGTRPNTWLSESTLLATINLWWNSVRYGSVGQSPSFSQKIRSTRWRNVYPRVTSLCAKGRSRKRSSSVEVLAFG